MLTPRDLTRPSVLWLTAGGLGFLRPGPGTWGFAGRLGVLVVLAKFADLANSARHCCRLFLVELAAVQWRCRTPRR